METSFRGNPPPPNGPSALLLRWGCRWEAEDVKMRVGEVKAAGSYPVRLKMSCVPVKQNAAKMHFKCWSHCANCRVNTINLTSQELHSSMQFKCLGFFFLFRPVDLYPISSLNWPNDSTMIPSITGCQTYALNSVISMNAETSICFFCVCTERQN